MGAHEDVHLGSQKEETLTLNQRISRKYRDKHLDTAG